MSMLTFIDLLTKLPKINELSVLSVLLLLIAVGFILRKIKSNKFIKGFSSIDLQDNEKHLKYKGPAFIAMLIVSLNYFIMEKG